MQKQLQNWENFRDIQRFDEENVRKTFKFMDEEKKRLGFASGVW